MFENDANGSAAPEAAEPVIQERLGRARQRSVFIATPILRHPVWQYTSSFGSSLLFLCEQGIRVEFQFVVGSSVIHKARNELVAHFLKSDCTDMLFIDDDMQWAPSDIMRLLASDKPLIGGVGRMRVEKPNSDPSVWCWRPKLYEGKIRQDGMGAIEALGFGAAFMLINKCVFNDMVEAHPEWKKPGPDDWDPEVRCRYFEFFRQNHEGQNGEMSEDYVFCDRWRQLGGEVWVDPTIMLGHVGSFNFKGRLEETLIAEEDR